MMPIVSPRPAGSPTPAYLVEQDLACGIVCRFHNGARGASHTKEAGHVCGSVFDAIYREPAERNSTSSLVLACVCACATRAGRHAQRREPSTVRGGDRL